MNKFISLYYILISTIFINFLGRLKHFNYDSQVYSWLGLWQTNITFTPQGANLLIWLVIILSLVTVFVKTRLLSILVFISIYIFFSFLYSLGKINHSYHIWIISSLLLCFLDVSKHIQQKRNKLVIRLIQTTLLSHYLISGFWKIRNIENLLSFDTHTKTALEHMAFAVVEGYPLNPVMSELVYNYPNLLGIGYILILVFQISTLIPILLDKYYSYYGILIIIFHCATGLALGIWFKPTILAAVFFLIITEELILKRPNFISSFRKVVFRN